MKSRVISFDEPLSHHPEGEFDPMTDKRFCDEFPNACFEMAAQGSLDQTVIELYKHIADCDACAERFVMEYNRYVEAFENQEDVVWLSWVAMEYLTLDESTFSGFVQTLKKTDKKEGEFVSEPRTIEVDSPCLVEHRKQIQETITPIIKEQEKKRKMFRV